MKLDRRDHVMNRVWAITLLLAVIFIQAQTVSLADERTFSFNGFLETTIHTVTVSDGTMYELYVSMPPRKNGFAPSASPRNLGETASTPVHFRATSAPSKKI